MTNIAEQPSLHETGANEQRISRRAEALDVVSSAAARVSEILKQRADRAEVRKMDKLTQSVEDAANNEATLAEFGLEAKSVEEEPQAEREDRGNNTLRSFGINVLKTLRATNELAVGGGILAGRGIKRAGEGFTAGIDTVADRLNDTLDSGYNKIDTTVEGIRETLRDRKVAAEQRKQARIEARQEVREAKARDRFETNLNKSLDRVEDKQYKEASAENKAFDREKRANEAKVRKDARRAKWSARKDAFKSAVSGMASQVAGAVSTGANAAIDFGRTTFNDAAESAKDTYIHAKLLRESAEDFLNDRYTAGVETAKKVTGSAIELGKDAYDRSVTAAERAKSRVDDVRAIGAGALEGAAKVGKNIKDQRTLGQ